MNTPTVCTIIVNWNGKADTLACLQSLAIAEQSNHHILVVDNGSTDDSVSEITAAFPAVELISTGRNLGFTGGNNSGIARAIKLGAEYVFLLNNDTTVEPGAISTLVNAATANPRAGILTPVIQYFDRQEEFWFVGSELDLRLATVVHANTVAPSRNELPKSIPWASGCAMLLPSNVARQLGGFDDRFFLNWEDVDLSLRAREAGYDILLVPAARIYHKVGKSLSSTWGTGSYYYIRNQLLLTRLHVHHARLAIYGRVIGKHLRESGRSFYRREPRALDRFLILIRAVFDFLRGKYGPINADGVM